MECNHIALFLAALLIIAGCVQKADSITNLGDNFSLKPGQIAAITSEGLTFRFVGVLEDSRCPQGVQCIWAGQTTIAAEAVKGNNKTSFNLTKKAGAMEPGSFDSMGYTFEFLEIGPGKAMGKNISEMEANAVFRITKEN
jgi:hypothetical protein